MGKELLSNLHKAFSIRYSRDAQEEAVAALSLVKKVEAGEMDNSALFYEGRIIYSTIGVEQTVRDMSTESILFRIYMLSRRREYAEPSVKASLILEAKRRHEWSQELENDWLSRRGLKREPNE